MRHQTKGDTVFPAVAGGAGFAHPVWSGRRRRSETAAVRERLARTLAFREGWVRRAI